MTSPSRRRWLTGLGGASLLAAAGAGVWIARRSTHAQAPATSGASESPLTPLFALPLTRPDGSPWSATAIEPNRPTLVNFWAPWCPPCVRELPELNTFAREMAPRGWQVLGVAVDQASAVQRFLDSTPVHYPVVVAPLDALSIVQSLGNPGGGLPFTVLTDRHGQIVERKLGATDLPALRQWAQRDL